MKRCFFLLISFLCQHFLNAQPYCTLPNGLKSTLMYYQRFPAGEISGNDFRFFYQVIVECGQSNNDLHDLLVLNNSDNSQILTQPWKLDSFNIINSSIDPCLSLPSAPCYTIYHYHADVYLGGLGYAPFGYLASTINCCRPGDAKNLVYTPQFMDLENPPPPGLGYSCLDVEYPYIKFASVIGNSIVNFIHIPPLSSVNSSPEFASPDTILNVCKGQIFSNQLKAVDIDGDSIAYHFSQPRCFFFPAKSSYDFRNFPQVKFLNGFSELTPVGNGVTLDQKTGLLSGEIADTGTFVVTISVPEFRNGIPIDSITKDLLVRVYDCDLLPKPKAVVQDSINTCTDFTIQFPNNSTPIYKNVNFIKTTFLWNFGDGDSSDLAYPNHQYADTGTYTTRLIIFPGLYCADTTYSKVLVYPYVNSDFTYTDSCNDKQIVFTNDSKSTSGKIVSSQWKIFEDSSMLFSSNDFNTNYTFQKASETYNVMLKVTNDKGCQATDSKYIIITQGPYPLSSHDTLLARGATIQFQSNDGNNNSGGIFNWWPTYGLDNASIPNPILTSTTDTTYHVYIKNRYGCFLTDSIRVKYYSGPEIYVPNAFSPNGDGKNDIFRPICIGISRLKYFRVFNRYGQLVFETRTPNQGWDGNLSGNPATEGVYVWEVSGIDFQGTLETKKGSVVLIR